MLAPTPPASALEQPIGDAFATVETTPVANSGDAADDMAIWRNPLDPAASLVIGNDKLGALETYDLSGSLVQRFDGGFYGNVDTRTAIQTGRGPVDVAVTYRLGIRIYGIDPTTRQLSNITDSTSGSIASPIGGEGICLYKSGATGSLYVFMNTRDGRIAQMRLADADGDGLIEGTVVRQWDVGEEVEGCVADDDLGNLYISEEDVAIWKYGAEPTASTSTTARVAVDRPIAAGGHFRPDAEGLTIVYLPGGGGYLIASSQAGSNTLNSYLVYDRLGSQRLHPGVPGDRRAADRWVWMDGRDRCARNQPRAKLPSRHLHMSGQRQLLPGTAGNQNFKFVPLERVVGLGLVDPPPPPGTVVMVVANPSSLIAGEVAVRNRLTNDGFSVTVIDDNLVTRRRRERDRVRLRVLDHRREHTPGQAA